MTDIRPGDTPDPMLSLDLIIGTRWELDRQSEDLPWRLVVIYRGQHCPLCKRQLTELRDRLADFVDAGCAVVSATMEPREQAQAAYDDWSLKDLPVAYGLEADELRRYGVFISSAISEDEPEWFAEPAILLFHGSTLHSAWVQSTPVARPPLGEVLEAIKAFELETIPPRGKLAA